jgi:hypothetical protein
MSTPQHLDRAEAISTKTNSCTSAEKNPVLPCEATLRVGFFFDGFGRNMKSDLQEDRLSNVARLFMAYPDADLSDASDSFAGNKRFYLSGLATEFDKTLGGGETVSGAGIDGAASRAKDSIVKSPEDTISNSPLDSAKDVITGKKWWESIYNNIKPGNIITSAIKATAPASLDMFDFTRDNELITNFFKTGVDTRLEAAVSALEKALEDANKNSKAPVKKISVSIFGFDFGASLARAFAHKIFEECDPATTIFKKTNLEITFMGLFDAVDRSGEDSIIFEYLLPFENKVDDGECLPGPVKNALHLIAAHECQESRRSRLIGTGPSTPRWEERLVPGTSYDVGGGLAKTDAPHSRELHMVSLHEMYNAAYRAGVPLYPMQTLPDKAVLVSKYFQLNDHINGASAIEVSKKYLSLAGNQKVSPEAFLAHRRLYIQRLRGLWEIYREQHKAYDEQEDRLARPILGKQGSMAKFFGMGNETSAQAAKRDQAIKQNQQDKAALRNDLGWLEDVDREAWRLNTAFASAPVKTLLKDWFNPEVKSLNFDIEDLLEFYVNDRYMIQQMPPTQNPPLPKYFRVRDFDIPSLNKTKGMAPDYLEQTMRKPSTQSSGAST